MFKGLPELLLIFFRVFQNPLAGGWRPGLEREVISF
jgi:hypothetical protein